MRKKNMLVELKKIDDKKNYFNNHLFLKKNKILLDKYLNDIKTYYNKRKVFGFQKYIYIMLFYYTYYDYL